MLVLTELPERRASCVGASQPALSQLLTVTKSQHASVLSDVNLIVMGAVVSAEISHSQFVFGA